MVIKTKILFKWGQQKKMKEAGVVQFAQKAVGTECQDRKSEDYWEDSVAAPIFTASRKRKWEGLGLDSGQEFGQKCCEIQEHANSEICNNFPQFMPAGKKVPMCGVVWVRGTLRVPLSSGIYSSSSLAHFHQVQQSWWEEGSS